MTMKIGDVILRQQLYQEIGKHLMTSLLWRILSSIREKKIENPNFIVFYPICLRFGIGGNFETLRDWPLFFIGGGGGGG